MQRFHEFSINLLERVRRKVSNLRRTVRLLTYTNLRTPSLVHNKSLSLHCFKSLSLIITQLSVNFFHNLQKMICLHLRFDEKSTALSFWLVLATALISTTILKIAKNYFKFADFSYTIRFQWHRL